MRYMEQGNLNLIPKQKEHKRWEGNVYTEENVFFGAGINKIHYTKDGLTTLCGQRIVFGWIRDIKNKYKLDCKICLKGLEKK